MDTSTWERVSRLWLSADTGPRQKQEPARRRTRQPHHSSSPLSPLPTGEHVMASSLKWHTITRHLGSEPVCCSHLRDSCCLKYFVISLAPLWLGMPDVNTVSGIQDNAVSKTVKRRRMCAFIWYKSAPYVFMFERKVGLLYFGKQ